MANHSLVVLLLVLGLLGTTLAQNPAESLGLWLDCACFRADPSAQPDSVARVEIYYGLNRRELSPLVSDTANSIQFSLAVYSRADSLLKTSDWLVTYKPTPMEPGQANQILSDLYSIWLASGEYKLVLRGIDTQTQKAGQQIVSVKVPNFRSSHLQLSDIQLALKISETTEQNKFIKNARLVWPNPTTVFGSLDPLLYFYAETYNLAAGGKDSLYTLSYEILDSSGALFKEYGKYSKAKPGNSAVVWTGLNIASLPMGKYQLRLTIADPASGQSAQTRKVFFVYREEGPLSGPARSDTTSEPKTEAQAREIRDIISYLATPEELRIYDGLTLEGKRAFLKDFWRSKDPDADTPINEYKQEIYRRFIIASTRFSGGRFGPQQGWKSDRGRIFMVYGSPDEIDPHPYSLERDAWEKWTYHNIQGGVIFVFEDQGGYGNYQLVHSTARGERRSYAWEKYLQQQPFQPETPILK